MLLKDEKGIEVRIRKNEVKVCLVFFVYLVYSSKKNRKNPR